MVNIGLVVILIFALLKKEMIQNLMKKLGGTKTTLMLGVSQLNSQWIDQVNAKTNDLFMHENTGDPLKAQGKELFNSFESLSFRIKNEYEILPCEVQEVIDTCNYECIINFMVTKPRLYGQYCSLINDLLVSAVIERELTPEDIDMLLGFLFRKRLYREIALITSLMDPVIPYYHFMSYSKIQLTRVCNYLLMISKSEATGFHIESIFNHKDGFNFVAPLISTENFDEETFENVVDKFLSDPRTEVVQFIHHICFGMALQPRINENRNEKIIKYIDSKLGNQSVAVYLNIKTCKILNLLMNDDLSGNLKDELIVKLIYKNAYSSNDSTHYIYELLMQVAESSGNERLKQAITKYF